MALGYCKLCDKLVSIRKGPQKWGSRECLWYPVPHEDPHTGKPCDGVKRGI